MAALARFVYRFRWLVVVTWIASSAFGAYAAVRVSDRWLERFSIPGYSAYEANQRMLSEFGSGAQAPLVAVARTRAGDVTQAAGVGRAFARAAAANPGARYADWFTTHAGAYVSHDRRTAIAIIHPAGEQSGFAPLPTIGATRAALRANAPPGVETFLTGSDVLANETEGGGSGPSVIAETAVGAIGALLILLFVFGTLPAVLMPLVVAIASILNTFTFIWALTYVTSVSLIVQFLVALVGLGVAIDYALLVIFRFREELARGRAVEDAVAATVDTAGRSVVVSGSTVAVGLLSMVVIPLPFIRSIGVGGMLIPAVSVLAAITLVPALLSVLGPRVNALRVLPRRIVAGDEAGLWSRWARIVTRHPVPFAAAAILVIALLLVPGVQLNAGDAQAKDRPGRGDAHAGLAALTAAGISPGVLKPFEVLVEGAAASTARTAVAARLRSTEGVAAAAAPSAWRRGDAAIVEAIPSSDGSAPPTRDTIARLQKDVLPRETAARATLGGVAAEERDFVSAVYSKFPYVLLFVVVLTFLLLARAFRSLLLPLKAVVLNLASLGVAYGIVVFVFQWGHGAEEIWNVPATGAIISWIPLMIFAFLYGVSMDYEVFILARMREEYDAGGDTAVAIREGLARTGKLVTSAAAVLCLTFVVFSASPGPEAKQFGIGLAAGIIFDATVIRALLVPSLMRIFGDWNWRLPRPAARALLVRAARDAA